MNQKYRKKKHRSIAVLLPFKISVENPIFFKNTIRNSERYKFQLEINLWFSHILPHFCLKLMTGKMYDLLHFNYEKKLLR